MMSLDPKFVAKLPMMKVQLEFEVFAPFATSTHVHLSLGLMFLLKFLSRYVRYSSFAKYIKARRPSRGATCSRTASPVPHVRQVISRCSRATGRPSESTSACRPSTTSTSTSAARTT